MSRAVNPFATTRKSAAIWGVNSKGAAKATKRARRRSRPRPGPGRLDDIAGLIPASETLGQVILPVPPVELSPNWRGHWSAHSAAVREYRRACWALALEAKLRVPDYAGAGALIYIKLDFFPPNRAARDDDNVPASFKAGRDGVADALACDDARFRTITQMHEEPRSCVVFSLIQPPEGVIPPIERMPA
jgi:crossover junction endodeoxyribonuclease RusA